MCGLAGMMGGYTREGLEKAKDALQHRGPDDSGIFEDPAHRVGLVHTRLSILDLSPAGHQPMVSEDGKVALVFNGELYNYLELKKELTRDQGEWAVGGGQLAEARSSWRGTSDTEVLLRLYLETRRKGGSFPDLLPRLNGMFALAIWDGRDETLWLARDAFGIKPLYLHQGTDRFSFASEIKALLPLVKDPGELDRVALGRYLSFLWCPGERTPFTHIKKADPGSFFCVRGGKLVKQGRWFVPSPRPEGRSLAEKELAREVAARLRTSVHQQMVSDVPVGAFLSGGLDSSAVVAFAREINPEIRCFTIQAADWKEEEVTDDLPYALEAARSLKVPIEVVPMASGQMAGEIESMITMLEEPLADPAALNILKMSQLARLGGVKVLLSGAGGDDLFAGYRRHQAIAWHRWWDRIPRGLREGLRAGVRSLSPRNETVRRAKKALEALEAEPRARIAAYFLWTDRTTRGGLWADGGKWPDEEECCEPLLACERGLDPRLTELQRTLALERRFFLADHNLLYTDKMSMAAGVEVRVPFLTEANRALAAHLPDSFLIRQNETKYLLKKAMEPYLPRQAIYRPKSGLGAPIRTWMRKDLKGFLGDILASQRFRERGIFNPRAVQELVVANAEKKVDAGYLLFSILCMELWCRRFVDRVP